MKIYETDIMYIPVIINKEILLQNEQNIINVVNVQSL